LIKIDAFSGSFQQEENRGAKLDAAKESLDTMPSTPPHRSHYSETVDLFLYDQGISSHPYIDGCNASIIYRLLENLPRDGQRKSVLDAGAGSGQVIRLLQGIPFLQIEACDIDIEAKRFFQENPETADVPYHEWDIVKDKFYRFYDAIIIRGVYHHIPKNDRPRMLANLCSQARFLVNADEGILEYATSHERLAHCEEWYGYVIREAERRGLKELAEMERANLQHERLNSADDGGDYKESPTHMRDDAAEAGCSIVSLDRLGNWDRLKGGFYTAVISR
jgi:SAM-dependent methyltransferase